MYMTPIVFMFMPLGILTLNVAKWESKQIFFFKMQLSNLHSLEIRILHLNPANLILTYAPKESAFIFLTLHFHAPE